MNLRQIESFKAVLETGTVTHAAARLRISQPAVSKLLQSFERNAGMVLFLRDKGRLTPTAEARLLYEEVDRVFQGVDRIRRVAEEIRSSRRGRLSIGVMPALSVGFAQDVLARMGPIHPGIAINIQARDTPRLVEQLVTRQVDLFYSAHGVEHPEIILEPLSSLPLVCILPKRHRLTRRPVIRMQDLAEEPFAALRQDSITRTRIDEALSRARVRLTIVLESPMAPTLCAFVARGLGISIVDPLYVGAFSTGLTVRPLEISIPSEIYLASLRARRLSLAAAAYAEASRSYASEIQLLYKTGGPTTS